MARRKLNAQEKQEREQKRRIAAEAAIKRAQAAQRRARQNEDRNMLLRIREITRSDLNWDMLTVILNHEFAVRVQDNGIAVFPLHMLLNAACDAEFPAEDINAEEDSKAAEEPQQTAAASGAQTAVNPPPSQSSAQMQTAPPHAQQGMAVRQTPQQSGAAPHPVQRSAAGPAQNVSPGTPGR